MAAIIESIEISRRPEDVFAYVTDPTRLHEWQESVVSVRRESDAPLAMGSRAIVTRRVGPREQPTTTEVAELTSSWRPLNKKKIDAIAYLHFLRQRCTCRSPL